MLCDFKTFLETQSSMSFSVTDLFWIACCQARGRFQKTALFTDDIFYRRRWSLMHLLSHRTELQT
jgi:hypothetical protein